MLLCITIFLLYFKLLTSQIFFEASLHDGCRNEIISMLTHSDENVTVIVGGLKQREKLSDSILRDARVQFFPSPPIIQYASTHSTYITENNIKEFYKEYKSNPVIQSIDAFICSFPFSQCEIYFPFNKSIIWMAAHRYSLGRCTKEQWTRLNEHLEMVSSNKITNAPSFIIGMNKYDVEYLNYYTGIESIELVDALGMLYGAEHMLFTQSRSEILLGPIQTIYLSMEDEMYVTNVLASKGYELKRIKAIYNHFEFQDLSNHRACVLFPYAVHSYGITELYALGIPLFVPTIRFLFQLKCMTDYQHKESHYCAGKVSISRHPNSRHTLDPEESTFESFSYWVNFADYYRWPHITYFDSFEELAENLSSTNFEEIRSKMMLENNQRLVDTTEKYKNIIEKVRTTSGRQVPQGRYEDTLQQLWNVHEIQAN